MLDKLKNWFEAVNTLIEEEKKLGDRDISDVSEFLKDGIIATKGGQKNEEDNLN